MTLTGFRNEAKSPEEWRDYIAALRCSRAKLAAEYKRRRVKQTLTSRQHMKYWSRYDVLSEFISRAQWELGALEKQ